MKALMNFLEKYFVPVAARVGAQRHLVAIRDGFVAIMPLMIVGSLAVLVNNLPIPVFQHFMTAHFSTWKSLGGYIWTGTYAVMAVAVTFSISYNLARSRDKDGLAAALLAFVSIIVISQPTADGGLPLGWLGSQGLFIDIVVALVVTELFCWLMGNPKLVIKMPEGVPPSVAKSFASLFPGIIIVVIFGIVKFLTVAIGVPDVYQWVFHVIQAPLMGLSNTLPAAILMVFLISLLWFFGLHGANIMLPIMTSLYLPALMSNMQAGVHAHYIFTTSFFDAFVNMGGSGTSLALLVAIFIASKSAHYRDLAKMAFAPGIFNINEPVMFGLPVVLNPMLFIPFILVPVVLVIISWAATAIGLVPHTMILMPWTTPPIIGGMLVTQSIRGGILALFNFCVAVAIYLPFIKLGESAKAKAIEAQSEAAHHHATQST